MLIIDFVLGVHSQLKEQVASLESDLSKIQEDARRKSDIPRRSIPLPQTPPTASSMPHNPVKESSPYMKVVASSLGLGAIAKNRPRVAPLTAHPRPLRDKVNVNQSQIKGRTN